MNTILLLIRPKGETDLNAVEVYKVEFPMKIRIPIVGEIAFNRIDKLINYFNSNEEYVEWTLRNI